MSEHQPSQTSYLERREVETSIECEKISESPWQSKKVITKGQDPCQQPQTTQVTLPAVFRGEISQQQVDR